MPEPQVRLEVIDCDAVVTVSSSFLAEAEPVQQEQTMQPAQLERPKVMDRASMFLRQQFRLTPAKRGSSIQSPKRTGPSPVVPEPQTQEEDMPQAVVAPRAESTALDVGIICGSEEEISDAE